MPVDFNACINMTLGATNVMFCGLPIILGTEPYDLTGFDCIK